MLFLNNMKKKKLENGSTKSTQQKNVTPQLIWF